MEAVRFTDEQELFRSTVRRLTDERITPRAAEIDETDEYPADMHELLVRNDLMAVGYPEDVGGSGGPGEFCILVEEISRASPAGSLIPLACRPAGAPILLPGSARHRQESLGRGAPPARPPPYRLT